MRHKLLLADDSVTIQRVIELTFADEDVQVLTAGDGEQAIAHIQTHRPDIVLADIVMPKRSGYDVAAFVRKHEALSHIPILLLTGAFEPVDEERVRQAGCDGVLVKPFEPKHVIARVKELLGAAASRLGVPATPDVPQPADHLAPSRPVVGPDTAAAPEPAGVRVEPGKADTARPDAEAGPRAEHAVVAEARPVHPEPKSAAAASLDDYFVQLDAAFAARAASPEPPPASPPEVDDHASAPGRQAPLVAVAAAPSVPSFSGGRVVPLPKVEPTLPVPDPLHAAATRTPERASSGGSVEAPPKVPAERAIPLAPRLEAAEATEPWAGAIADAFASLLEAEHARPAPAVQPAAAISEETVDLLVQRVVGRLGSAAVRDMVKDVVSELAERLIRDEIHRIRTKAP